MKAKVLLADDEELILRLAGITFRDAGRYTILLAQDGQEALWVARTSSSWTY